MNDRNRQRYKAGWSLMSAVATLIALLSGCGKTAVPPEEVRPVRTLVVQMSAVDLQSTYAGEVRPRYESDLGFRVGGKISQRLVNVGDSVKRGQILAKLDPQDLSLAEASSRASLAALKAQLGVEKADLERDRQLVADNVISQSAYDRQLSIYDAAQAQYEAAQAQLRQTSNQRDYAGLRADHDGAIAGVEAEAGQVVAAGQTVVRLAWSGETEVAVNVPEDQVQQIAVGMPVEVTLWSNSRQAHTGKVRELSASADAATRTYSMRVSVPEAPPEMRLGMTATVRIPLAGDAPKLVRLPLGALVEQQGHQGVWLFDPKAGAVGFRPTQVVGVGDNELLVAQGLSEGERVITAGAALLHEGQKVRPLVQNSAAEH